MAKAAKCDAAALERALQTDEIPPDTPPLLWMAIKSIKQDTADTRENLTKLELRTKALEEIHQSQDDDIHSMKASIQVLTAQVRRSEIAQSQLQHEVEDLKARSVRDNIIFNFDADVSDYQEAAGENCVHIVNAFLHQVLGISKVYVSSAHRLGKISAGHSRPMIARIPDSSQRADIFKNAKRLHSTKHFISAQIPPSRSERKQFAMPEYKAKKEDPNNRAMLRQDKLYVRGKLQTQYTQAKLPHCDNPSFQHDIKVSKERKEGGSSFRGFYTQADNLQAVSSAHTQLICRPDVSRATYLIYAYRLEQRGKIVENFDSDRDWGTGHELLKAMRDNGVTGVCFATRICNPGYIHIGKKRFQIITDLCMQSYKATQKPF
jgi:hypothetical protein